MKRIWYKIEWFIGDLLLKLGFIRKVVWQKGWKFVRYYF
jgi:hypothetical protein